MRHDTVSAATREPEPNPQDPARVELVEGHLSKIFFLDPEGTYSDDHNLSLIELLEDISAGHQSVDELDTIIDAADRMLRGQGVDEFDYSQWHGKACPISADQRQALKLAIVASKLPLRGIEELDRAAE
jgi:hypothetical protein